jgi:hypothetical protein
VKHGVNPFFSVGICCYPFMLEPSGSVFIPLFSSGTQRIPTEENGSSLNGYERIGTDRNRFNPDEKHGVNLFLSVGICCYPFMLEPSGSVFIPFFFPEEHNGHQRKKAVQA